MTSTENHGTMIHAATWELLARCREIAQQLRDIGEEQHADDVTALIEMAIECEGRHR